MPLRGSISDRIRELHKANKEKNHGWTNKQIVAIAYHSMNEAHTYKITSGDRAGTIVHVDDEGNESAAPPVPLQGAMAQKKEKSEHQKTLDTLRSSISAQKEVRASLSEPVADPSMRPRLGFHKWLDRFAEHVNDSLREMGSAAVSHAGKQIHGMFALQPLQLSHDQIAHTDSVHRRKAAGRERLVRGIHGLVKGAASAVSFDSPARIPAPSSAFANRPDAVAPPKPLAPPPTPAPFAPPKAPPGIPAPFRAPIIPNKPVRPPSAEYTPVKARMFAPPMEPPKARRPGAPRPPSHAIEFLRNMLNQLHPRTSDSSHVDNVGPVGAALAHVNPTHNSDAALGARAPEAEIPDHIQALHQTLDQLHAHEQMTGEDLHHETVRHIMGKQMAHIIDQLKMPLKGKGKTPKLSDIELKNSAGEVIGHDPRYTVSHKEGGHASRWVKGRDMRPEAEPTTTDRVPEASPLLGDDGEQLKTKKGELRWARGAKGKGQLTMFGPTPAQPKVKKAKEEKPDFDTAGQMIRQLDAFREVAPKTTIRRKTPNQLAKTFGVVPPTEYPAHPADEPEMIPKIVKSGKNKGKQQMSRHKIPKPVFMPSGKMVSPQLRMFETISEAVKKSQEKTKQKAKGEEFKSDKGVWAYIQHHYDKKDPTSTIKAAVTSYLKHKADARKIKEKELKESEHNSYSSGLDQEQLIHNLTGAMAKASAGDSELDHAIYHWLTAEVKQFGHFRSMPLSNLKDNWDDYCSLMHGAHMEHMEESVSPQHKQAAAKQTKIVNSPKTTLTRHGQVASRASKPLHHKERV